jgi:rare lipoprotein A
MLLQRALAAAVLCLALTPALAKPSVHLLAKSSVRPLAKSSLHRPAKSSARPLAKSSVRPHGEGPVHLVASVYWEGVRVAAGKKFDPNGMTVAHRTLPFGTRLVISYGTNVAEVVVNDRGPFVRGRELDLTRGVAHALHFPGLGKVRVAYWPPLPRARPSEAGSASRLSEN